MTEYKFKGEDRVLVNTTIGLLEGRGLKSFTGTIIACTNDIPIWGQVYVVLADNPKDAGIMTEIYPFLGVIVSEISLTKLPE